MPVGIWVVSTFWLFLIVLQWMLDKFFPLLWISSLLTLLPWTLDPLAFTSHMLRFQAFGLYLCMVGILLVIYSYVRLLGHKVILSLIFEELFSTIFYNEYTILYPHLNTAPPTQKFQLCSPNWPWTQYVTQGDLKFMVTLLSLPPNRWDYMCAPLHLLSILKPSLPTSPVLVLTSWSSCLHHLQGTRIAGVCCHFQFIFCSLNSGPPNEYVSFVVFGQGLTV